MLRHTLGSAAHFEHRCCHRPGERPAQRRQTGRGGDPAVDAAQPNGFRRGQVECLAVAAVGVQQCDQRVGDVVDRNDVGAPGVGQHDRSQPGQHGQLGQHTEEVIRPVDLVHLTGARIADHHRRPVDPVPQPRCRPHQQFGFEFRLVIWRRQLLADVEIVFGVFAVEISGHRDRRDVVQCRVEPARQLDDGTGALHVGRALLGFGGGDVVDRRTVHDVADIRAQIGDGLVGQPEARLGQLAHQRFCSFTPLVGELFEATQRRAANQDPHLGIRSGVQQTGHHAASNKPGTAGNDIAHATHRALGRSARQRSVTRSSADFSRDVAVDFFWVIPQQQLTNRGTRPVGLQHLAGGAGRTRCGHQNQRPSRVAMDGVMNERTISVSNSRPRPMVVPIWPSTCRPLNTNDAHGDGEHQTGGGHHRPEPAIARMMPVFSPAWISSLNREISSRL